MGKAKPRVRLDRCCFTCRHWSGQVRPWQDVGETRGTCAWLANLIATHASIGIPAWVPESRHLRTMYDDDGADCPGYAATGPHP